MTTRSLPWTDDVDRCEDVRRAIEEAHKRGNLGLAGVWVLDFIYAQGWTIAEFARFFEYDERAVRRVHTSALRALKETGLLKGYD